MAHRVEVGLKPHLFDARGERVRQQVLHALPHLKAALTQIRCVDVYNLDSHSLEEHQVFEAFCDPVIQDIAIDAPISCDYDWYIEVGYKPGVTDNVGRSATYALELISGHPVEVFSAHGYHISGRLPLEELKMIARECLSNELIQSARVVDPRLKAPLEPYIPRVSGLHDPVVEEIDLDLPDEALLELSRQRTLALNIEELKRMHAYLSTEAVMQQRQAMGLGERITDVELEALAQTWSEHCKHKIFNAHITYEEDGSIEEITSLFKTYIQGSTRSIRAARGDGDICVSVFTDNAGVIRFNNDYHLVFKVETHNSPSALDPYGGALTGIVGVNRDPFGTGIGARLIFNTDVFCFASPFYSETLPPKILHPRRIFEGVREGVEHGGNKSGIPTINGCLVFDPRYLGKPLVYCGTAGIMPVEVGGRPAHVKHIVSGDLIVMTGGRIGKDGIHGATFSSEELHEGSPTSAVQIGDPITQKKMTDFLLVARDRCLYRAITDNGAGGLSSSIGEMAELSGGCHIELEKPPLKYHGLSPWEILLSEAQERMTLAVPPENIGAFLDLASEMGVEASVIGTFTDSGFFHCTYAGRTVAYITLDFLHNGLPQMHLKARWQTAAHEDIPTPVPDDHDRKLSEILGRLNICSKEGIIRQYDHEVQGGSVIKPLTGVQNDGPSDAAVIRPILTSMEGVVVSNGIIPRYSDLDTYHMAACALDEALRNYVCVGGDPHHWACLDNFCWCDPIESPKNPDGTYKLAQLVRANKALYDYTRAFDCPLISGKDSMKNDYLVGKLKISIPPTLLISVIGRIADVRTAVTMDCKAPGDRVYLLGKTRRELGASEYLATFGLMGSRVPEVDAKAALMRYELLYTAIKDGLIASAHDLSDGGLAVALAETSFAGGYGLRISLAPVNREPGMTDTEILYAETASRILLTLSPEKAPTFEQLFGSDAVRIGEVTSEGRLVITGSGEEVLIDSDIEQLKSSWKATLDW